MSELDKVLQDLGHALLEADRESVWRDEHGTLWRMGESVPITVTQPGDPARILFLDDFKTVPVVHRVGCYICEDPEFAAMGLPLCRRCPHCGGHIPADSSSCDDCGRKEADDE